MAQKVNLKRGSKLFFDILMVTLGCFIMAIGITGFCVPNEIAPGGFSGLATILYLKTGFPVGVTTFLLCFPLFLLTLKDLGVKNFLKTLYGTFCLSLFIDLTTNITPVTDDILLASVFGGIVIGVGIGLVFKFKGTTGGTDLLALLIHKKFKSITIGTWLLILDFTVISIAGIVLKNVEVSLYSVITVYICMKVIDLIQDGMTYIKAFYIFTDTPREVTDAIFERLDRGVTLLQGRGGYKKEEREVVFCVVTRTEVTQLKELVIEIDPNAFVILADVHEVQGEGFKSK